MKTTFKNTDQIPPGRYLRTWGGYQVVVEVRNQGGRLIEITPTGSRGEPRDNPGATYESIEVEAA